MNTIFNIEQYKHTEYNKFKLMNKETFPQTMFSWTEYDKFNEVYAWAKENCLEGKKTKSGGIAGGAYNRYHSIYFYNAKKTSVELIIAHLFKGCYKFVITMQRNEDNKKMTGKKALKTVLKKADELGVLDVFKNEAVDSEKGKEIKKEIESPMIELTSEIYKGREFEHCFHLDANSSYFSRICEQYPDLKPLGEYLYSHRKENDGLFKAAMTNSIGCMQSQYCINIEDDYYNHYKPYSLSKFAKVAVNGTNRFIEKCYFNLMKAGFKPLLFNTDGIWYQDITGKGYHDELEGTNLGQWKNDHKDVKLYIKSPGAYQYIENGKVKTVLRGVCALDYIKPDRDTWEWKEIANQVVYKFKFDPEVGVIKYE